MKFVFFNDTGRRVGIHPATLTHGCICEEHGIEPFEERIFELPENTFPWVKMWDYGEKRGLSILVSPRKVEEGK